MEHHPHQERQVVNLFDNITLGELIGRGGYAKVFEGTLPTENGNSPVIVKLCRNYSQPDRRRAVLDDTLREGITIAALSKYGVGPEFYGYAEQVINGEYFFGFVMEKISGDTLEKKLNDGILSVTDSLNYTQQVLSQLAITHKAGFLHRDVHRSNIIVQPDGKIRLIDWGTSIPLQRIVVETTNNLNTKARLFHSPPEQLTNPPRGEYVGPYSDVYTTGILLWELLTGEKHESIIKDQDIDRKDPQSVLKWYNYILSPNHWQDLQHSLEGKNIPVELQEIIKRATQPNVHNRYSSAEELELAIKGARGKLGI